MAFRSTSGGVSGINVTGTTSLGVEFAQAKQDSTSSWFHGCGTLDTEDILSRALTILHIGPPEKVCEAIK
jgi:hypothetical protein